MKKLPLFDHLDDRFLPTPTPTLPIEVPPAVADIDQVFQKTIIQQELDRMRQEIGDLNNMMDQMMIEERMGPTAEPKPAVALPWAEAEIPLFYP